MVFKHFAVKGTGEYRLKKGLRTSKGKLRISKKKAPNGEHIKISENLRHTIASTWRNQCCESHQHLIYARKLSYPSNKCITLVQISIQQCLMITGMNTAQWHALILKNYKF